jgi:hypothetical protein
VKEAFMAKIACLLAIAVSLGAIGVAQGQRKRASAPKAAAASSDAKQPPRPSSASAPASPVSGAQPAPGAAAQPAARAAESAAAESAAAEPVAAEPAAAEPAAAISAPEQPGGTSQAESLALQQELAQLMDDLVQARERVAVIGKSLWKTRVRVRIDNRAAPEQVTAAVVLRLDGAPIFTGDGSSLQSPDRPLYDGYAAPGPHVLELEIEQRAKRDQKYRYNLRESYRFEVLRERRTDLTLVLDDDSDIADDFADDQQGEYDVRTRLDVEAVGLDER